MCQQVRGCLRPLPAILVFVTTAANAFASLPTGFDPAVALSGPASIITSPDVAADGSDVYVVWYQQASFGSPADIFIRSSGDEGKSFHPAMNVSANGGASRVPRVAAAGSDVYVVWEDDTGTPGTFDVFFRRSRDQGWTWDFPVNLSKTPSKDSRRPAVSAIGTEVYVVWEETVGGATVTPAVKVRFRRSKDQGAHFDDFIDVSGAVAADSLRPAVAAAGSNVYVAWQNDTSIAGHPDIFFRRSTDEGATWPDLSVSATNLSANAGASLNPSIAAVGSAVYVLWDDDTDNPGVPEVFYNLSANQGESFAFSGPVSLQNVSETPAATSRLPRVAAAGSSFDFIWQDDSPGQFDLFFSRRILGSSSPLTTYADPKKRLTANSSKFFNSVRPSIAISGSRIFIAYEDPLLVKPGRIMFIKSTAQPGVAATDVSENPARPSITPTVASAGKDVYTVWAETGIALDLDVFFRASNDGGKTFLSQINLSSNIGRSQKPVVAVAGQAVFVAWQDDTETPDVSDIYFRRSLDRGATWDPPIGSPPINLSMFGAGVTTADSRAPTIAATGSEVYVEWEDDTTPLGYAEAFGRRSLSQGQSSPDSWEPGLTDPPSLSSCPGAMPLDCKAHTPSLAAAGSNVYLALKLDRAIRFDVAFCFRNDQLLPRCTGATEATDHTELLGEIGADEGDPRLAASGSSVYAVWWKAGQILSRTGSIEDVVAWDPPLIVGSSFFPPPRLISAGLLASRAPSVAASGSEVYVAWQDETSGPPEVWLRSSNDGANFSAGKNLSKNPGTSANPALAASGPEVYAVWEDDSPPLLSFFSDIFLRESNDEAVTFP